MLVAAIDTNVIVAARRSRDGASNQLLKALRAGKLTTVASVAMMIEYEAVLKRPEHLAALGITEADVDGFLDALAILVKPVTPHFLWRPSLRDPADEMILDTAVSGCADAIVTFNRRDFLPAASRFALEILTPIEALRRL